MKKCIVLLVSCLFFTLAFASNEVDSLLQVLDQTMSERPHYEAAKESKIDTLKGYLHQKNLTLEQIYSINNQLIEEYEALKFDSAMLYMDRNLLIAKSLQSLPLMNECRINLARISASSGRYLESVDILNEIESKQLSKALLVDFYTIHYKVCSELIFYNPANENIKRYKTLRMAYKDSLLQILSHDSEKFLEMEEDQLCNNSQFEKALAVNDLRLTKTISGTRTYSLATFQRSLIYEKMGQVELQKKYLAYSAISDIRGSIKDNISLTRLARFFFEKKEIDAAYRYIKFSFEDAVVYNSRLRHIQISNILPLITQTYQIKSDEQKSKLQKSLITISLLSLILFIALIYIYFQLKKISLIRNDLQQANQQLNTLNINLHLSNEQLNNANTELSEANLVKEQYIGTFFNICSDYINKLDAYRKMVNKHIVSHQIAELFEITKSSTLIETGLQEFYQNFDNTFLNIYPDFVEQFNRLLLDTEKIILKKGELLTIELRLFALIRLGISDSSDIAKLLRYSVNTIYNYRVKIKNKASVPREDFEVCVMKIGTFHK